MVKNEKKVSQNFDIILDQVLKLGDKNQNGLWFVSLHYSSILQTLTPACSKLYRYLIFLHSSVSSVCEI
jgi:hypothetical protein